MADAPGKIDRVASAPTAREMAHLHLWQIQAVRDAMVIASLVGLVWLGYAMRSVTVPLLVALLLAYLFEPLIVWACDRYSLRRPFVVSGLVCSIMVVFVLCVAIAVPLIVGQSVRMVRDLRSHRLELIMISMREHVPESMLESFDATAESITGFIGARYRPPRPLPKESETAGEDAATQPTTLPESAPAATEPEAFVDADQARDDRPDEETLSSGALGTLDEQQLRDLIRLEVEAEVARQMADQHVLGVAGDPASPVQAHGPPVSSIWALSRSTVGTILDFLGQVLRIGFLCFLIPFYLFFFSMWYPQIVEFGNGLIPNANHDRIVTLLNKMDSVIAGFVRGRIVISLIIGVICAIGWSICGVPYAIVLGLITGIFSAVPYLGFVGLPVAVLLLWVDQMGSPASMRMSWFWIIGGPTLVYVIMQVLETYIITPMIAGKATNLDPVTILVAVLAGGSVGGIYGMLLAIPAAACLKILMTDVMMPRIRMWVRGRAEDPLPL